MPRIHRPRSTLERIGRFRGEFAYPSNFHRHPSDCCDHTVPTAEHAFQTAKTRDGRERDRIRAAPTPAQAKRLGRRAERADYDVIEFPHALIASQLDAAQEEGYGYSMASASERLREDGRLPAATAALHNLADRHPRLFADTVRYLFGVDRDIARAVTESVRLGYAFDQPLDASLNALAAHSNATETGP